MSCSFQHKLPVVLTMLLVWSIVAGAQLPNYQLNRIQEEEGLKTSDIINIAKGKQGFLWLASQGFVQQFDGRNTLKYEFKETVNRIFIDGKNRKWVLTRTGVYLFNDSLRRFKTVPFEKKAGELSANLYENLSGTLLAIGAGKHYVYDENKSRFDLTPPPIANNVSRYFGKYRQSLFLGNANSIFRYQQETKQTDSVNIGSINAVILLNENELLVSTFRYKTYHVNFATRAVTLLESESNNVSGDKLVLYDGLQQQPGQYLISSNRGIFSYTMATGAISRPVIYYDGRPLENQSTVTWLYKDDDGNIYMNHADGIFFLGAGADFIQYFRNYSYGSEKMPANDVRNFTEDEAGNIWMATTNGIARLNMQTGELKTFDPLNRKNILDYPSYRQLLNDGDYLWIGTSGNGVWFYEKNTGSFKRPVVVTTAQTPRAKAAFEAAYIWKLIKLANGKLLTIGGSAAFITEPVTLITRQLPLQISGISRSAIQDSTGRIWHGTTNGLTCMDTTFNPLFRVRDSFPDKRVASFCEWRKDKMLVGSKGLFEIEIEGNKVVAFKQKKSIPPSLLIYCMKKDANGFIWLGTEDGIYRFDPLKDEAIQFERSDHVQSQAFNSDGAFLSSAGLLFMGGKNGVNYFDPLAFSPAPGTLNPQLLSLTIEDTIQYTGNYKIPYSSRNIDFIISAPEFNKPFRLQYRYRLRAKDEWTNTRFNNRVRISKLQPGYYALQVSASYDGNTWFDGVSTATFTVLKPWWQTWWAMLIWLALAVSGILAIMRYRRKRREAAEVKRMIEYFTYAGTAHPSVGPILWDITRNCISRLGFEDCVIYLLNGEKNVLVQKAAYGAKSPQAFEIANPLEIPVGKGITGHVAQTARPLIIKDTSKDGRYIVDDERRFSEITVPIVHDGKVIGVIDSEHKKKNFFTRHHLKTLETISSLCASKIATAAAIEAARKAETEVLLLNGKMMESKFLNLRLQMNPHFLFNILTSIQYLIISNQVNKATSYLDVFAGFLRSLLSYAEATVVTLEEELRILEMYVKLESLCLDATFVWNVTVSEEIDKEEVLVPFMLLQPFVENSINHGLVHKIGEKRFYINISEHDADSLVCVIEDNGIGRSASGAINRKNLSSVLHQSKGIGIVEQRLELLQQKTLKKACFEIEDLYKNGEPTGTRVRIIIPYYSTEEI
jgi:ligand-binding sensor domain-containing protein/putative methionine-R-sulfoxide reductase with GAF domain